MSTVVPQTESLKRAVKWVSEHLIDEEEANVNKLANEATMRFDLSPKDAEFLLNLYKNK